MGLAPADATRTLRRFPRALRLPAAALRGAGARLQALGFPAGAVARIVRAAPGVLGAAAGRLEAALAGLQVSCWSWAKVLDSQRDTGGCVWRSSCSVQQRAAWWPCSTRCGAVCRLPDGSRVLIWPLPTSPTWGSAPLVVRRTRSVHEQSTDTLRRATKEGEMPGVQT